MRVSRRSVWFMQICWRKSKFCLPFDSEKADDLFRRGSAYSFSVRGCDERFLTAVREGLTSFAILRLQKFALWNSLQRMVPCRILFFLLLRLSST